MKNKELQEILKQYDDDMDIKLCIQSSNIGLIDKISLTSSLNKAEVYNFSIVLLGEDNQQNNK